MSWISNTGPLVSASLSFHTGVLSVPGSWNLSLSRKLAIRHGLHWPG